MIRRNDTQYSKFWMGDDEFEFDPKRDFDAWDTDTLLRLASFKRAVANFVRIVTGKDIPVLYNTGEQSYTQGSAVVLSAKLEHNQFDTSVGTALHEATHCVLTDFTVHEYMRNYQEILIDGNVSTLKSLLSGLSLPDKPKYVPMFVDQIDHDLVLSIISRIRKLYPYAQVYELKSILWDMSKLMENWVEDRRIDYFQFTTSPGYKGYYNAMYSSFFWSKLIGKAIRAKNYARTETWASYKFRIINLLHPDADLDALKGLREIWSIVDLKHIDRLKSVLDSWNLGFKILDVVLRTLELDKKVKQDKSQTNERGKSTTKKETFDDEEDNSPEPSDDDEPSEGGADKDNNTGDENYDTTPPPSGKSDEESEDSEDEEDGDGDKSGEDGEEGEDEEDGDGDKSGEDGEEGEDEEDGDGDKSGEDGADDEENLSPAQQKRMEKEEEKQKSFLDGTTPKKKMSKQAQTAVKSLESGGVTLKSVGQGLTDSSGHIFKVQCVVIGNVTKELIDGGVFSTMFYQPDRYHTESILNNQKAIEEGFRLGTMLGKRLQIRNESRTTKFNRLETGRIDKKLLASLGYENERVFFRTMVDKFNPMMMHISVDGSGSMSGQKWKDTLTLLVSIIKAASMTSNLNVVVSVRGTTDGTTTSGRIRRRRRRWGQSTPISTTGGYGISVRPLVAIVYDSRVDKLHKVMSLFKYICPGGATPDGLAFEPLIDDMVVGKDGEVESVFVNISDGEPCFGASINNGDGSSGYFEYGSENGSKHTAMMVQKMRNLGIKILSYFIGSDNGWSSWANDGHFEVFKKCYGKDSSKIDTRNIVQLARTLNAKFLEKNN